MTVFLLGLFGGLFLLGGSEVRSFESAAAKDIQSRLEGKPVVHVQAKIGLEALSGTFGTVKISASQFSTEGLPLFTEPKLSHRGRVHKLVLDLRDFRLRGMRIESLSATIPECRFDLGLAMRHKKIRLSESGVGTGSVDILDSDLAAFALDKFHEIKRLTTKIADGHIVVDGYGEFLIFKTGFHVEAALTVQDGDKLLLTDAAILFDGKPADDASKKVLLDTLNPIVDLNSDLQLYGAIKVDKIELQSGHLIASGATQIPVKP